MTNVVGSDSPILKDRNSFKQWISKQRQIVIVKISATWCGPCKRIKNLVYDRFMETNNAILVEVDYDKNSDIVKHLRVSGVPTLISFKDGYPDKIASGGQPAVVNNFFNSL